LAAAADFDANDSLFSAMLFADARLRTLFTVQFKKGE
jgi:hypothetical protein